MNLEKEVMECIDCRQMVEHHLAPGIDWYHPKCDQTGRYWRHRERYRAAMLAMSRFLVFVSLEAEATWAADGREVISLWRKPVLLWALERGLFRLEWP